MANLARRIAARFEDMTLRVAARFEKQGSFHNNGKFLGRDCRLTWNSHGWRLEELPVKGKKKCKVATIDNPGSRGWVGFDAYIDNNILMNAHLSASDSYEILKQKMLDAYVNAAERTLPQLENAKNFLWISDIKWNEHEEHYLKIVPEDTAPIEIEGKDEYTVESEWTKFKVYDPKADFQNSDPNYTMYEASSPTAARKLYQMAKADPNLLKNVAWSGLSDWLTKNKIPFKTHLSQWH